MEELKNIGYSSYKLRQEKIFGEATMTKFRKKEYFNFDNLNRLCDLLQCQPGDLLEYVPDEEVKEETTQKEVPIKKDEEIKNTSKDEIQKEQKEEIPKQVTVQEMKKVAQIKTPFKLKKVGNRNKTNNIS